MADPVEPDAHERSEPPVNQGQKIEKAGLAAVRWRWADAAIGLAPFFAFEIASYLEVFPVEPVAWLITFLGYCVWTAGFPLYIARRRAVPIFPRLGVKRVFVEFLLAVPLLLATWLVYYAVIWLLFLAGQDRIPSGEMEYIAERTSPTVQIFWFSTAVVISPIAEEIFCRGFLLNVFRRKLSVPLGVVLQAAFFASCHASSFAYVVVTFVTGLCLGLVYLWRRTLLTPVFIHVLHNLVVSVAAWAAVDTMAHAPSLRVTGIAGPNGFVLSSVSPDGPAGRAGLQPGDTVTFVDGSPVRTVSHVRHVLASRRVGDPVEIEYFRDGQRRTCEAVLVEGSR